MQQPLKPNSAASSEIMDVSPISSGASLTFPSSGRDSSTPGSVSSYAGFGSEEVDVDTCRNMNQVINYIRGGDHRVAAWRWHMVQNEIDAMAQVIYSKAETKHTLAWSYKLRLLAFADEITKLRLSPDKLFVVLRLHKVLDADFFVRTTEYNQTLRKLREAVFHMLRELKVLIKNSASRSVPGGGGVHEVTRYVMNYIRLLLHHRSSVSSILVHNYGKYERMNSMNHIVRDLCISLEDMLNTAAEAYGSGGLHRFFLMNNLRFIVKQDEGLELSQLFGHSWVQMRNDFIDQHMKAYIDLSWGPVVSILQLLRTTKNMRSRWCSHSSKTVRFCLQFHSTYCKQEHWNVEDPRLREVVRRAVCNKVISAYREHFQKSSKVEIQCGRYTPELLEEQLMQLFEGRTD